MESGGVRVVKEKIDDISQLKNGDHIECEIQSRLQNFVVLDIAAQRVVRLTPVNELPVQAVTVCPGPMQPVARIVSSCLCLQEYGPTMHRYNYYGRNVRAADMVLKYIDYLLNQPSSPMITAVIGDKEFCRRCKTYRPAEYSNNSNNDDYTVDLIVDAADAAMYGAREVPRLEIDASGAGVDGDIGNGVVGADGCDCGRCDGGCGGGEICAGGCGSCDGDCHGGDGCDGCDGCRDCDVCEGCCDGLGDCLANCDCDCDGDGDCVIL